MNRDLCCHAAISYDDDRGTEKQRRRQQGGERERGGERVEKRAARSQHVNLLANKSEPRTRHGQSYSVLQAPTTIAITITSECFASWVAKRKTKRERGRRRKGGKDR